MSETLARCVVDSYWALQPVSPVTADTLGVGVTELYSVNFDPDLMLLLAVNIWLFRVRVELQRDSEAGAKCTVRPRSARDSLLWQQLTQEAYSELTDYRISGPGWGPFGAHDEVLSATGRPSPISNLNVHNMKTYTSKILLITLFAASGLASVSGAHGADKSAMRNDRMPDAESCVKAHQMMSMSGSSPEMRARHEKMASQCSEQAAPQHGESHSDESDHGGAHHAH